MGRELSDRRRRWVPCVCFLLFGVVSCHPAGDGATGSGDDETSCVARAERADGATHPLLDLTPGRIQLPFPSAYLTRSDPTTRTGARLTLERDPPALLGPVVVATRETDLAAAVSELDGFSTLGPILIPFSGPLALPAFSDEALGVPQRAGEGWARIYDITGEPAPVGLWRSFVRGRNVLVLRPAAKLPPGHRILVCLVGPMRDAAGNPVVRPYLFDAVMQGHDGVPDDPLVRDLREVRDRLNAGLPGVHPEEVVLAFSYWTGSREAEIRAIREAVDDLDATAPILPEEVTFQDARTVTGSFLSPEFRMGDHIQTEPPGAAPPIVGSHRLTFLLRLSETVEPLAPVIYLHGLGGSRADAPTMSGLAVFAIDAVEHGERAPDGAESPFPFLDLTHLRRFRDNIRQTAADEMALARAIGHLSEDPAAFGLPAGIFAEGTLAVLGHSLGCINGSVFAAADPQVDHLACIGGGGMISVFPGRSVYGLFMPAAIHALPPAERLVFDHLMQAVLDAADPAALAPGLIGDPPGDRGPRNVLAVEAVGDRSVPNRATEALAWLAGLGVNEGAPSNLFGLPEWPLPVVGNIVTDGGVVTGLLMEYESDASPTGRHGELFASEEVRRMTEVFLRTAAETGVGHVVDPEAL